MINLSSIKNKCLKLKLTLWCKWCLVIIHLSSNHPSYPGKNIIKNTQIHQVKKSILNKRKIIRIMMIKCILWKKIIKGTLIKSMISKKILSWLLDKILVPYLKLKTMLKISIISHQLIKNHLKLNTINSRNLNKSPLLLNQVLAPLFLPPKKVNKNNNKIKINNKTKAMKNGKLNQIKNNK